MTESTCAGFAWLLDGRGGGRRLERSEVESWVPEDGILWAHVAFDDEPARGWMTEDNEVPDVMAAALFADDTRPRSAVHGDAMLLVLRGANLNPGADAEDMVSVRAWIRRSRIFTTCRRPVQAVLDVAGALASGNGPLNSGDFLVLLADRLVARMADVVGDVDEGVDRIEDHVLEGEAEGYRVEISRFRRQAIALRRHIAPQRDVIARLQGERVPWLEDADRMHLRELADRTTRYVEDLDSARERAAVAHEELSNRLSEQMNRNMYVLSVVAAVFLPLSLLTGLLGINVGGIPGTESQWAFLVVCAALVVLGVLEVWVFRRRRWF